MAAFIAVLNGVLVPIGPTEIIGVTMLTRDIRQTALDTVGDGGRTHTPAKHSQLKCDQDRGYNSLTKHGHTETLSQLGRASLWAKAKPGISKLEKPCRTRTRSISSHSV